MAMLIDAIPNAENDKSLAIPQEMVVTSDGSTLYVRTFNGLAIFNRLADGRLDQKAGELRLYLDGNSYEVMAEELGCDCKTIDNALQRVKRKIVAHQKTREVLS